MKRRAAVLFLLLLPALSASTAVAGGGATGDAATIAFYRQVKDAYAEVPGARVVRHGYLSYEESGTILHYERGERPSPGYERASEVIVAQLSHGTTESYVDTARAAGLPTLTIVGNASGTWARSSAETCWERNPIASSEVVGYHSEWVGVIGHFQPLVHRGSVVIVTSSYPWGKTATATEVDRISVATKRFESLRVTISGPGGFSYSDVETDLAATPPIPTPTPSC